MPVIIWFTVHALFAKYAIGGADELQYCQRGTITAVCRGQTCLTINGKTARSRTLNITCSSFLEQPAIGAAIPNLSLGDPQCCLIKLARDNFAIDFIIYQSQGTVASRVLYFIQVSGMAYQAREIECSFRNQL